jgi:hypothetical protein
VNTAVLSNGQRRLWLIDRLRGGRDATYNLPATMRLLGPLDVDALSAAAQTVVARHDSLRARFPDIDGEPVQLIRPAGAVPLPIADISGLTPSAQLERIDEELRHEWSEPFNLTHGPVLRLRLLRLGPEAHVLLRTVHHIAFDTWSQSLWNEELAMCYQAGLAGVPCSLPGLPMSYAEYREWEQAETRRTLDAGLAYWTRHLADLPAGQGLPTDHPRPAAARQTCEGGIVRETVQADMQHHLTELCQTHHVTLHMAFVAALAMLIARHSSAQDIVVGVPMANRGDARSRRIVGFLVNFVVMRVSLPSAMRVKDVFQQVKAAALAAWRHRLAPFDVPRACQVVFALQNARWCSPSFAGLQTSGIRPDFCNVSCDLEVYATERSGQLEVQWRYNRALFTRTRIAQLAGHYRRLLSEIATHPEARVWSLDMLGGAEKAALLDRWKA